METIAKFHQSNEEQNVKLEQYSIDYKLIDQKLDTVVSRYKSLITGKKYIKK